MVSAIANDRLTVESATDTMARIWKVTSELL